MQAQATRYPQTRQGVRDLDRMEQSFLPISGGPIPPSQTENLGAAEQALSLLAGGILVGAALVRPTLGSLLAGVLGCALIHRGYTRHCELYQALGVNRSDAATAPNELAHPSG